MNQKCSVSFDIISSKRRHEQNMLLMKSFNKICKKKSLTKQALKVLVSNDLWKLWYKGRNKNQLLNNFDLYRNQAIFVES